MKNNFGLLLCLLLLSFVGQSQNLIRNGGFEHGDIGIDDCLTYQNWDKLDGLAHWRPAFNRACDKFIDGPIGEPCPTPDWFDREQCFDSDGAHISYIQNNFSIPKQTKDGKFLGMLSSRDWVESWGIELTEALIPGEMYEINVRLAPDSMSINRTNSTENPRLIVSFSEQGGHWNDQDKEKWSDINSSLVIDKAQNKWQNVSFKFKVPKDDVNGIMYSKLKHLILFPDPNKDYDGFLYVDDVSLYKIDPCNSICTDSNALKPVKFGEIHSSNFSCKRKDLNGKCKELWAWSYKIAVYNATDLKLEIYDRWGGKFYEHHQWNPNVLRFEGEDHFGIEWAGSAQDGSRLADRGNIDNFLFAITAKNCKGTKYQEHMVSFIHLDKLFTHIPDHRNEQIDTLKDCCPDHLVVDNFQYVSSTKEAVDDYIHSGRNANVTVTRGTNVEYNAGNEIILGNNFSVASGGSFEAILRSCVAVNRKLGKSSMGDWVSRVHEPIILPSSAKEAEPIQDVSHFSLYPNPTSGVFTIEHKTKRKFNYKVFNFNSQEVLNGNSDTRATKIDLSTFDRGLYYIMIENEVKRIIKY